MKERAERNARWRAAGNLDFPTSDEIYRWAADKLGAGEYKPTSTPGKYLMLGAEGAGSMLMPLGVAGEAIKAKQAATAAGKSGLTAAAETAAPGLTMGAAAPVAAEVATEYTGAPGAGLAAGIFAPTLLPAAKKAYSVARSPVRGARNEFIDLMSTPAETGAAIRAGGADYSPYGAPRTTPQATLDPGLAAKQVELLQSRNASDEARQQMAAVLARQRQASSSALEGMAGEKAEPLAVARTAETTQRALQDDVARLNRAASTATDPVEAANLQRQLAVAERKLHDSEVSTLYRAVDPDGVATVPLTNLKGTAERMLKTHDPIAQGEMAPALNKLLTDINSPDLARMSPYQRGLALDQRIEDARRGAVAAGDNGLARQLGELKTAIMADLENVQLPPTSAAAGVTPAETLRAAKDKYIEGVQRFENPYVESSLRSRGYGRFNMLPEDVANRVFVAGDKGEGAAKAWLEATANRPEGLQNLQAIALDRLHKERLEGNRVQPITQDMLDAWKKRYGSALGAIDAVSPGFSAQFDNAAIANARLGEFAQSQLGKYIGVTDPKAVQNLVSKMVVSPEGSREIATLLQQVPGTERATVLDGLRRAGVTGIINRFTSPDSGAIQGIALAKFIRGNEGALRTLYGDNFTTLTNVADELARYERVAAAGATRGSPTGFNMSAELVPGETHAPNLTEMILTAAVMHPVGGAAGSAAVTALSAGQRMLRGLEFARNQTIKDIIADAIFDPAQARALLSGTYRLAGEPTSMATTFKALGFSPKAMEAIPNINVPARAAARGVQESVSELERREQERRARGEAAGGSIRARKDGGRIGKIDHAGIAASLIRAAEKAKKGHNTTTEPLLEQPDEAITKALAIANEALA